MKHLLNFLLLGSILFLITGCDVEDIPNEPQSLDSKYRLIIGTFVSIPNYLSRSDPDGSIFLQKADGSRILGSYQTLSIAGSIDLELTDGKTLTLPISSQGKADANGDISFTFTTPPLFRDIKNILGMKLNIQTIKDSIKYSKSIDYSGATVWSKIGAFSNIVMDFAPKEFFRNFVRNQPDSQSGTTTVGVDIANDVILVADGSSPTNKMLGQKRIAEDNVGISTLSRPSIKEVGSSKSQGSSKASKSVGQ